MSDERTPSERYRPRLVKAWSDTFGLLWYAIYGDLIAEAETPEKAFEKFDRMFKDGRSDVADVTLRQRLQKAASELP